MIENMWKLDLDSIDAETKVLPNEIVEAQCDFLVEATNKRVIAKIAKYNGLIYYNDDTYGDGHDDGNFTFEFFITSHHTPNYKFRVFFMSYDAVFYPTHIVLENGIAEELRGKYMMENSTPFLKSDGSMLCQNEEEFKYNLSAIINSQRVKMVVQNINLIDVQNLQGFQGLQRCHRSIPR